MPTGIYRATLPQVLEHFGTTTLQRRLVGQRLKRIYTLATSTGQIRRFAVFGSFVTATSHPNDVDIFLIMADTFNVHQVQGEAAIIFDHQAAQNVEGPAYSGFGNSAQSVGKTRPWPTGKPNAITHDVA